MKVLTLNYQNKEGGKILEVYKKCIQWMVPETEILEEEAIRVTLPLLKEIPDVKGDWGTNLVLSFPEKDESARHTVDIKHTTCVISIF